MRLYATNKQEFCTVFVGFFVALILVAIIGLSGPPITTVSELRASKMSPPINKTFLPVSVQNSNKIHIMPMD